MIDRSHSICRLPHFLSWSILARDSWQTTQGTWYFWADSPLVHLKRNIRYIKHEHELATSKLMG